MTASLAQQRRVTEETEEALFLLDSGESAWSIAGRLGVHPAAMVKRLRKRGHREAANAFLRVYHTMPALLEQNRDWKRDNREWVSAQTRASNGGTCPWRTIEEWREATRSAIETPRSTTRPPKPPQTNS